ncbi:MAG: TPM domain-containing protein [Hyphomicrobiales bacterium]|nr:TPM domain-containing protein [Hyphomicrobiales bacterium]
MTFLSEDDRTRIEQAVAEAEKKTSAEFVTVIARAADDYLYIPTLVAACVVLILSGLALMLPVDFGLVDYYAAQVVGFVGLALLFRWTPLKMRIIPQSVKRRRARLLAHQAFLDLGLSSTKGRTGVMLFVAAAEHYVEILADRGINENVGDDVWPDIVADFVNQVRSGCVADGFIGAIGACTDVMAKHHPWTADDTNELPNRLVEL